jgi:hypothetical protein
VESNGNVETFKKFDQGPAAPAEMLQGWWHQRFGTLAAIALFCASLVVGSAAFLRTAQRCSRRGPAQGAAESTSQESSRELLVTSSTVTPE